jgi:hypothetical protein
LLARVSYTTCSDSIITDMDKTAAGKKKLAVQPPEGMIRPVSACGKPPAGLATAPSPTTEAPAAEATPNSWRCSVPTRPARPVCRRRSSKTKTELARQDSLRRASRFRPE